MINYSIVKPSFEFNLITELVICVDAITIAEVNIFNDKFAVGCSETFKNRSFGILLLQIK